MSAPSSLPLATASLKLRRRPDRPRKAPARHDAGRPEAGGSPSSGKDGRALAQQSTAEYLAVSYRTVRGWVESGKLAPVRLGERLIRIERADLDRLIETRKELA
ncbi:MAG: helix-turn-helix domain-containing protein [Candidatus Rokubacteria bacterium]|nr:helix-turn-helix domain-containing protein [Candidatus Rokubacteria bacterium]